MIRLDDMMGVGEVGPVCYEGKQYIKHKHCYCNKGSKWRQLRKHKVGNFHKRLVFAFFGRREPFVKTKTAVHVHVRVV